MLVAVVLGLCVLPLMPQRFREHVTDCGFDAQGAFAKVRVYNLLGDADTNVQVAFHIGADVAHYKPGEDAEYDIESATAHVQALSAGTVVVHGHFPPHGSWSNPTGMDLHVHGRTVYRFFNRLVTKQFALKHQRKTVMETAPDDRTSLNCSIWSEED